MYSLGEITPNGKAVRKLLSVLLETWESKVEAITEARDLDALAMDDLIGNLITYELKKNQEKEIGGKRKERNLVLKATALDDFEDENIALMTKRFTRMLKRGQTFQKKTPQKSNENTKDQVCHKCGSPDHFIKFCPLWALEQKKTTSEKGKDIKKDKLIPSNRRMTTQEENLSMKKAFAAIRNSSDDGETENKTLLALEQEDSEEDKEEEDMNEKGLVRKKQQQWYLNSACSRHMTGDENSFLSLRNFKRKKRGLWKTGEIIIQTKVDSQYYQAIRAASHGFVWTNACTKQRSVLNKTPYELLKGRKPNLGHLRAFGCVCFIHNNDKNNLGKFDAKSDEGIFLGYSSQSKAYKVLYKRTNRVEESVHIVFNESNSEIEGNSEDEQNKVICSKSSEPKIWEEEIISFHKTPEIEDKDTTETGPTASEKLANIQTHRWSIKAHILYKTFLFLLIQAFQQDPNYAVCVLFLPMYP
ncbi:uncharacterized protein [Solanum lycopersicum]|uniref:uncharacterized protein n=1 Tax=Solanum lycopersicum TaxID=4081 RepID=UPI003748A411